MTSVVAQRPSSAGAAAPAPGRPLRPAVAWTSLGAGALLVTLSVIGPAWVLTVVTLAAVAGGLTALQVGARRNVRPDARTPWRHIRWACWLFVIAMVIRLVLPATNTSPPTVWSLLPNSFVIPGYVFMGLALTGLLRRRRAAEDDSARADALLVGLAAAFLAWTYLVAPSMANTEPTSMLLLNAVFPIFDVVLMGLAAQLGLAGSRRQTALWLLLGACLVLFAGDLLFIMRDGGLAEVPQAVLDVLFVMAFLLVGVSALHPSMGAMAEPQAFEAGVLGRLRTAAISAMVVGPALVAALGPRTTLLNETIRAFLLVLLVLAVVARIVRANNSRARAERATRRRATHDALTDLPNRELLAETVAAWGDAAAAEQRQICLLFIDLDRFKMVNDHWGHQVGDELLVQVAGRLGAEVREDDLVCRLGGDEFVIALAGSSRTASAEALAGRVLAELTRPFELSVGSVVISASIGVARSTGGAQALELIRDADTAMYQAKRSGRNGYAMFDASLREQVRARMSLEQALRGALANGELAVHFQPIHRLGDDSLSGYEALMRWHHPELGAVSPLDFIPIAEETGLIVESGAWLLHESVRQLARWTADRPAGAPQLHVSVNVSVRQLRDDALVGVVRDALAGTGLPASALWLEITESGVMEDIEGALRTLGALRELGVVLCIDDFGTGYSSLSYLHRLPVGVVKIDRSFMAGVGEDGANEAIVRAVLAMTHAMGHRVVAEGVETEVQRDWLRRHGCELAQGWLYGRPVPAGTATAR